MSLSKKILNDLLQNSPCTKNGLCDDKEGHWCILREIVLAMGLEDRNAEQLALVYDYKYMRSKQEGSDIGKERAFKEFIQKYGQRFSEVYQEGLTNGELFERVFGFKKEYGEKELEQHISSSKS